MIEIYKIYSVQCIKLKMIIIIVIMKNAKALAVTDYNWNIYYMVECVSLYYYYNEVVTLYIKFVICV